MFQMPNTMKGNQGDKRESVARAEMDRVADFNLKNKASLTAHPRHWNGVEKKLGVREQAKRLKQFSTTHPDHPLTKRWNEMQAARKAKAAPKAAPKGSRSNPHSSVTTQT